MKRSALTLKEACSYFVLMESSKSNRRFPPPWTVECREHGYDVQDATGFRVATVYCDESLSAAKWRDASRLFLTRDEARRIAKAIARLPEFLMQRKGFDPRGQGLRWKATRPYHVALEDIYIRANWDEIDALCKLNGLPFNATGEKIGERGIWCVYEFERQLDAIQFWNAFNGRWLRGSEFIYPEQPKNLPPLKPLMGRAKFYRGKGGRDPNNGWL